MITDWTGRLRSGLIVGGFHQNIEELLLLRHVVCTELSMPLTSPKFPLFRGPLLLALYYLGGVKSPPSTRNPSDPRPREKRKPGSRLTVKECHKNTDSGDDYAEYSQNKISTSIPIICELTLLRHLLQSQELISKGVINRDIIPESVNIW